MSLATKVIDKPALYQGDGRTRRCAWRRCYGVRFLSSTDFSEAIRVKPDYAEAYVRRGNAYLNVRQYDKAIADQTKSIQIRPDFAEAYVGRGNAYMLQRQYDKAIADYAEAIRRKPDFAEAYVDRGFANNGIKAYDKATADFNSAVRLQSDLARAYVGRGIDGFVVLLQTKVSIASTAKSIGVFRCDTGLVPTGCGGLSFSDPDGFSEIGNGLVVLLKIVVRVAAFNARLHVISLEPDCRGKVSVGKSETTQ